MSSELSLNDLNPAQRDAVLYTDGPSLVIAGAGSGKTRVLTYKIAWLLQQGMAPWNILALTFTNKAADEMKTRIAAQVGEEKARRLWMGTFHSIFARILRAEHEHLAFSSNFTIYDAADSKSLVRAILREMQLDEKVYKPGTVLAHISAAKNRLVTPDAYQRDPQAARSDAAAGIPATGAIYARYMQRCRQSDAMDFDDILLYTYFLLAQHPEVRERYENHFQYVLVDEYQDTNYAQHAIVWQLTQTHRRVCVVGDDAQSIYSFRGANIDNILTFQRLYEGARLFKLEQNYRSTQTIVNAANSLIRHNRGQIPKAVFSQNDKGQPIHVYGFYSDIEEASGVAKRVTNLHQWDHIPWNEMAILYRTNAQSRTFEESFRRQEIPYRIYGGLSFYQRKEVKDMIAYFRLVVNPNDEEALKRVINYPARGIGQTTVQRITEAAGQQGVSLWSIISSPALATIGVNRGTQAKLEAFVALIQGFMEQVESTDAATLGRQIARASGVEADIMRGRDPEDLARQENLQELMDGMQQFVDDREEEEGLSRTRMTHYLQEVALISDLDESDDDSTEKLPLMTVHAAKGLEFRVVFVVGMEENLFPNQMASTSPRELEEERRLFYVALTRAKEQCYLSYAQNRYKYGKSEFCAPSPFLRDIAPQYLELHSSGSSPSARPRQTSGLRPNLRPLGPHPQQPHPQPLSQGEGRRPYPQQPHPRPLSQGEGRPSAASRNDLLPSPLGEGSGVRSEGSGVRSSASPSPEVQATQTAAGTLVVGTQIEHARFGRGEVIALAGTGIDAKATVRFQNVGVKQLLLRFAKFTIVN